MSLVMSVILETFLMRIKLRVKSALKDTPLIVVMPIALSAQLELIQAFHGTLEHVKLALMEPIILTLVLLNVNLVT